jgi:hypothetical protein
VTINRVWSAIGFIEHLYTQLVTTSNYNSRTSWRTLKITVTAAHIVFHAFTSRFLVTDPNNVLCLRSYRLANISQLTHCSNWLTPRLAAISHKPSTLLFTDWLTEAQSQSHFSTDSQSVCLSWCRAPSGSDQINWSSEIVPLITSRQGPHRKHSSSLL